jgi:FMN phosphatase YigB (HAD superfamily)
MRRRYRCSRTGPETPSDVQTRRYRRRVATVADRSSIDDVRVALDPCPEVVLVDCFGTLLHRRAPTQRIRQLVSIALVDEFDISIAPESVDGTRREIEREWTRRSSAAGHTSDHRLDDLAAEIHRRLRLKVEREAFVLRFCEIEVEMEARLTRTNADLIDVIDAAVPPDRVCVLSDTNLTQSMMRGLLEARRAIRPGWRVVTSGDGGDTKRSGELYRRIAVDRKPGERWVMIGDDPHADGSQAQVVGIEAVLVSPGRWDGVREVPQRVLRRDSSKQVAQILEPVGAGDVFPEYALTMYRFSVRLDRSLRALGSHHAVFLAREGAFLQTLFDTLQAHCSTPTRPALTSAYLLTSRKSTFVPALNEPAVQLAEFLNTRPSITVRELLDMMSLDDVPSSPEGDDRPAATMLDELLACEPIIEQLASRRREQGTILAELVEQASPGGGPTDLIDVGWQGTVRSQLARALPDRVFRAHLLGLVARSDVPATEGVLFANRPERTVGYQVFSHFKELHELLLAGAHGSVACYSRAHDGSPLPILDDDADELAVFDSHVRPFQDRCLMRFAALIDALASEPPRSGWLDELTVRHHARMMYRPTNTELDFVAQLRQRENFGASVMRSATDTAPSNEAARGLRRHVSGGGWPPLRMKAAGANWQRAPYALYKYSQRMTGRLT